MGMKIEHAHRASELRQALRSGKENWRADQNEDQAHACAQEQQTSLTILAKEFEHGGDGRSASALNQL
jgi:hypothetical protein